MEGTVFINTHSIKSFISQYEQSCFNRHMNSPVLIGTNPCINKAMHMLSMHRFDTFNTLVLTLSPLILGQLIY